MSPVEKLEAAIERLERLKRESDDDSVAPVWENRYGTGGNHSVVANYMVDGTGASCQSVAEHVWDEDAELIVTLHRTIDAQRAILTRALNLSVAKRGQIGDAEVHLANAILGNP